MERAKKTADRLREVILNGRWIANTNYKDQLENLTWKQAITKIESFNTIVALTFHINYYLGGVLQVFEGKSLAIRDKYSFDFSPTNSKNDWNELLQSMWNNTENLAKKIELLPDEKLDDVFVDVQFGSYQRNIDAMIEHSYYHLGQITLIKKMVLGKEKKQ